MSLPEAVRRGVEALRAGKPAEAVEALGPVYADVELAEATDLIDIRARIASLYAQALLDLSRWDEAQAPLADAMRLAKRVDDEDGVDAIKLLQARLVQALGERHRRANERKQHENIVKTPIETLLAGDKTPLQTADVFLRKATAHVELGEAELAESFAERALAIALAENAVREEVLSRMMLARAAPSRAAAELAAALSRATTAEQFNLVGGVVKAAELSGVELPRQLFAGRHTS